MLRFGVLVRVRGDAVTAPSGTWLGQVWEALWQEGMELVVLSPEGLRASEGCLWGEGWSVDAEADRWVSCEALPLQALYNRFPLQGLRQRFAEAFLAIQRSGVPLVNTPVMVHLVWDKARCGQILSQAGLPVPQTVEEERLFGEALLSWGRAYLKPRQGAFGEGIFVLEAGAEGWRVQGPEADTIRRLSPSEGEAWLREAAQREPLILQEAIAPPLSSLAGFCVRSLVQRTREGAWRSFPRVARLSTVDPVANVARGAEARPLDSFLDALWGATGSQAVLERLDELEQQVVAALLDALEEGERSLVVELGVDYVVDPAGRVWVLEVNGFPQGRLEWLFRQEPERFAADLHQARMGPFRYLQELVLGPGAPERPEP